MSELVLKSMYVPEDIVVAFRPHFELGICIQVQNGGKRAGLTISRADASQLRDFLNKELGDQPSKPVGTGQAQQLLLAWQSMTDGLRYAVDVASETDATSKAAALKRSDPQTPVRLARVIKEFVQPTPSYEWKDL